MVRFKPEAIVPSPRHFVLNLPLLEMLFRQKRRIIDIYPYDACAGELPEPLQLVIYAFVVRLFVGFAFAQATLL